MSRTIRRKNAWNIQSRIFDVLRVTDHRFNQNLYRKTSDYADWSTDEIYEFFSAYFHSDCWFDEYQIENSYRKGHNRKLRRKYRNQLVESLKRGEEEDFLPINKKSADWLYSWLWYW